jgi:threonylcarbamoyladenosine tRNA methylthiotransferase MtaB
VPGDADLYLVNACTVTSLAERKARQAMHRLRREQPRARILVVGCLANAVAQGLTQIAEADLLAGNAWKAWIEEAVARAFAGEQGVLPEKSPPSLDREAITSHSGHVRAFLKVQDGCDFSCTFCRTTQVRGASCSKSVDAVLAEARLLVENSYRELVLTGINLAQYAPPNGDLASLVHRFLRIEKLRRLRLASINPYGITAELVAVFAKDPRACPHFHIPLQSGDDDILRRMQRGYTSSFYRSRVELIRQAIPQATFGADLIVGFPGEDETAFARTCAMIEEVGFANLHIFRYSPREGTEAASFAAAVHEQDKKRRAGILDKLGRSVRRRLFDGLIGSEQVVLIEEKKDGYFRGYTRGYIDVHIPTEGTINTGDEVRIAITGATDTCLLGGEIRSN